MFPIFSHHTMTPNVKRCPPNYQLTLIFWCLHVISVFAVLSKAAWSDRNCRAARLRCLCKFLHQDYDAAMRWNETAEKSASFNFGFGKILVKIHVYLRFLLVLFLQRANSRRDFPEYTTKEWHRHPSLVEANQHQKMGKVPQELTVYLWCCSFCPNIPVRGTNRMADNGVRLQESEMEKLRSCVVLCRVSTNNQTNKEKE